MRATRTSVLPIWSRQAATRGLRAAIVIPGLFALCSRAIGNPQMATFAAFGGFATLVLANFGGRRRDKLVAHAGLAAAGCVLLVIGTAVNTLTVPAALVTLVVAFLVLFAGVASANIASGGTAALLAYVLPAASPGTVSMIPSRLAGWLLASAAGTGAVMVLYIRPPTDRLRRAAAGLTRSLADEIDAGLAGNLTGAQSDASIQAKHELLSSLTEVPYRPTGLTVADQAIAGLVEAVQWCTTAVAQAFGDGSACSHATGADRDRLMQCSNVLRLTAELASGGDATGLREAVNELDAAPAGEPVDAEGIHRAFHSRMVASACRSVGLYILVASRRMQPDEAADEFAGRSDHGDQVDRPSPRHPVARAVEDLIGRHTSLRSIWFLNSARGAVALAAAVAIADVLNVQHGFWVVLGALSVLRTSAASTGATALRALVGTVAGFFIGAALILWIGGDTEALWAALPVAVFVAAYAPGTAPFAVGQAAFTVTISILYNLIAPVGWKVGELRVEDVAIGAAVSAAVGVLFWPRGATRVVANDIADAFHAGGLYLVQAAAWALGVRDQTPDAASSAQAAGTRLDDALRGLLAEQGTHRVPKEILWRLAGGALRLRLTARALTRTRVGHDQPSDTEIRLMMDDTAQLAGQYDKLAAQLGNTPATVAQELADLTFDASQVTLSDPRAQWVSQHVGHLRLNLDELTEPALAVSNRLSAPWWR
jgi:uncharacterized membrane protein YccC